MLIRKVLLGEGKSKEDEQVYIQSSTPPRDTTPTRFTAVLRNRNIKVHGTVLYASWILRIARVLLRHLDFVVRCLRGPERNRRKPHYFYVVFNMIFHKFTNFHRRFFRPIKSA